MVKSLLESGFPVNHRDKYNKTALHHAVEGLNYDCVRFLLAHGSTQNVKGTKKIKIQSYYAF